MAKLVDIITEGPIKHIASLQAAVRAFVIGASSSYLRAKLHRDFPEEDHVHDVFDQALDAINNGNAVSTSRIKSVYKKTFPRIDVNDVPQSYRKFYPQAVKTWEEYGDLRVELYFGGYPDGDGSAGLFDQVNSCIQINGKRLGAVDFANLVQYVASGDQRRINASISLILHIVTDLVSVANHELIHFYQFSFLEHGSGVQTHGPEDTQDWDSYASSNLEIPAFVEQIAGEAKRFVAKNSPYFPKLDIRNYLAYVTSSMSRDDYAQQLGIDPKYLPGNNHAHKKFFAALKQKRPASYKRAVSNVYQKAV